MKSIKYIHGVLLMALLLSAGNNFAFGLSLSSLNRGVTRVWNNIASVNHVKESVFASLKRVLNPKVIRPTHVLKIAQKHQYITGAVIAGTVGVYVLYKTVAKRLFLHRNILKALDRDKKAALEALASYGSWQSKSKVEAVFKDVGYSSGSHDLDEDLNAFVIQYKQLVFNFHPQSSSGPGLENYDEIEKLFNLAQRIESRLS